MRVDLRGRNLERVTDGIFNHAVSDEAAHNSWWWQSEIVFEPIEHVGNLTSIFRNPQPLRGRYTRDQMEQGFWFLISGATGALEDVLWDARVPWNNRALLIASTVDLYRQLFAHDPLDTSAYMFWDALAYGYCVPTRHPETDVEDSRVQGAMFGALQQILAIDSVPCQLAALHGLGHLRHPNTERVICLYLERNPRLTTEHRGYALACITGDIQ